MVERQSSGLVKKGKFVRRLMELMGDGKARDFRQIWVFGSGDIGPNQEYVKVNLDKLVASGEMKLSGDEYQLPEDSEWLGAASSTEEPESEEVAPESAAPIQSAPPVSVKPVVAGERDLKFETFVGICFMQDVPTWEVAADFYARLHGVTYSIVKYDGKMGGERLNFHF